MNRRQLLSTMGAVLSTGCLRLTTTEQSTPRETPSNQGKTQSATSTQTTSPETAPLDASAEQLWEVQYTVDTYRQHVYVGRGILLGTLAERFALVEIDGSVRWTQSAGDGSEGVATWPAATEDRVVFADRNTAFALDTATGEIEWQTPLPIESDSPSNVKTQAVVSSGVVLFVFNYEGSTENESRAGIAGFDTETGELLWHRSHTELSNNWDAWLGIQSVSPPIGGKTLVGGWNNAFWLNITTGELGANAYARPRYRSVRANGSLYCIDSGRVRAFTISDGNINEDWEFDPLGRASSAVAVAGSQVYMAADDTGIYAVEDGQRVWRYQADNTVQTVPAVSKDTVWAGENKLYMIDRNSGAGQTVTDTISPTAVSAADDMAFVTDAGRTVAYQRQA